MKARFILLSLALIAAGQALPANAQEGGSGDRGVVDGGMRWNYRPNVWGSKKASKPAPVAYVPHAVSQGAMPKSSAFLGVDPSMLKPAPKPQPIVQQQVQAVVQVPHATIAPFNKDFGAPVALAMPKQMTESPMPAAKSMSAPRIASRNDVSGRVRPFSHSNAQSARSASLPQIASYGGQGYTPGVYEVQSSGSRTDTNLSGRIISKTH